MIFFDTNVLVYFSINQDMEKQRIADERIELAVQTDELVISPLVMVEYIFVLAKLKQMQYQGNTIEFFHGFVKGSLDGGDVFKAYELCSRVNACKNINDVIHIKYAERHCKRLITFDKDFSRFKPYSKLEIEILA